MIYNISYICYIFYAIIMGKYRNTKEQKVQQSKEHYQKIDYKNKAWNYPLIFSLIKLFQAKLFFQENRESLSSIQDVYGERIFIIVLVNTQATYNKMSVLNIVICALHLRAVGIRCANHVTHLYPQKLALTSPTGGGRSVGMVRSRTKATEFSLV
jgi:hypothetical protein